MRTIESINAEIANVIGRVNAINFGLGRFTRVVLESRAGGEYLADRAALLKRLEELKAERLAVVKAELEARRLGTPATKG